MINTVYSFGNTRIDPARRLIVRADRFIELPSSAFDCLVYLIHHRERAIGRDELISAVWGRADISENLLSHTLVRIRRALADGGDSPGPIRTVPRFGYHWTATTSTELVDCGAKPPPAVDADQATAAADAALDAHGHGGGASGGDTPGGESTALAPFPMQETEAERSVGTAISNLCEPMPTLELSTPFPPPQPAHWRRMPSRALAAAALPVMLLLLVEAFVRFGIASSHAGLPHAERNLAALNLVLPAHVDDSANADWMRLGVMDAVAHRLRRAQIAVMDSEDALLLQRDAAAVAAVDHSVRRIEPRVQRDAGGWRVDLISFDGDRELRVSGVDADVIAAARTAAENLSLVLGAARETVAATKL